MRHLVQRLIEQLLVLAAGDKQIKSVAEQACYIRFAQAFAEDGADGLFGFLVVQCLYDGLNTIGNPSGMAFTLTLLRFLWR